MKIIDRYLSVTLLITTALALTVLLALFAFLSLIDQLEDAGHGNYNVISAVQYVLLTLPRIAYELFPVAAVIGSMTTLGLLSHNSELVIIRASGTSLFRLAYAMGKGGLIIVVITIIIGEIVAPYSEQKAQNLRSTAMNEQIALKTKNGFWSRDGLSFINIRRILPGDQLEEIYIYEFDDDEHLRIATHARRARYADNKWLLENIEQSVLETDHISEREIKLAAWNSLLNPDVINLVAIKPQYLTIWGLFEYISYLKKNGQNSFKYEQALWAKLINPVTILAMIILAVPLVSAYSKSIAVSQRIFFGCFIGIFFNIINQVSGQMGVVYSINSFVSASFPTIGIILLVFWLMYKKA